MEKSSRKRASTAEDLSHDRIKAIVVDFDDSIVASSFVKEKIYGHVKDNCSAYLTENYELEDVKKFLEELKKETVDSLKAIPDDASKDEAIKIASENIKLLLNKAEDAGKVDKLVVMLLKKAIEKEEFVVELHDDVQPALKEWVDKKIKIVSLSPKSVEFQKLLLFAKKSDDVAEGDVQFETLGDQPKSVKETYAKVADKIQFTPSDVLFVTTSHHEARAASAAGLEVVLLRREEDSSDDNEDHTFVVVEDLKGIFYAASHPDVTPQKVSRQQAPAVHN